MSTNKKIDSEIGSLPEDWDFAPLSECVMIKGRIGWKGLKVSEYVEKGPYIVGGLQIENNGINWEECAHITGERYFESPEIMLKENDILMTKDGTIGKLAYIRKLPANATVAAHIHVIRSSSDRIVPEFLFYIFQSPRFQSLVESKISGSVVPALTQRDINSITFPIPPLDEQKAISKIFLDLDAKIELNRQMNKTLESMGQTIFKHWFIEFEFLDENGRPYKSSGGEMVDSELGMIPKGWKVKPLGDILELAYGKALKEGARHGGSIPVYGSNGQIGWHDEYLVKGPGIIVGRKGNPGTITWSSTNFFPIDTAFYVISKETTMCLSYLFLSLQRQDLVGLSADSAVPGLNRNIAYMSSILIPPSIVLSQFDSVLSTILRSIQQNNEQNSNLALIRDALLPELMTGRIRVPISNDMSGSS
jgi:type I restriction enzyme S subunit